MSRLCRIGLHRWKNVLKFQGNWLLSGWIWTGEEVCARCQARRKRQFGDNDYD